MIYGHQSLIHSTKFLLYIVCIFIFFLFSPDSKKAEEAEYVYDLYYAPNTILNAENEMSVHIVIDTKYLQRLTFK